MSKRKVVAALGGASLCALAVLAATIRFKGPENATFEALSKARPSFDRYLARQRGAWPVDDSPTSASKPSSKDVLLAENPEVYQNELAEVRSHPHIIVSPPLPSSYIFAKASSDSPDSASHNSVSSSSAADSKLPRKPELPATPIELPGHITLAPAKDEDERPTDVSPRTEEDVQNEAEDDDGLLWQPHTFEGWDDLLQALSSAAEDIKVRYPKHYPTLESKIAAIAEAFPALREAYASGDMLKLEAHVGAISAAFEELENTVEALERKDDEAAAEQEYYEEAALPQTDAERNALDARLNEELSFVRKYHAASASKAGELVMNIKQIQDLYEGSLKLNNEREVAVYREEFAHAIDELYAFIDALVVHTPQSLIENGSPASPIIDWPEAQPLFASNNGPSEYVQPAVEPLESRWNGQLREPYEPVGDSSYEPYESENDFDYWPALLKDDSGATKQQLDQMRRLRDEQSELAHLEDLQKSPGFY